MVFPAPDATTVRMAFESIEMVVTDFLPTVPLPCYLLLLETLGAYVPSLSSEYSLW